MRSCPAPSSPGTTAIALPSIGMTAMRWFSMRALHDDVGALEHVALVARADRGREVRAELLELQRRAGRERGLGIGDRRQRVVLDDDGLGRVGRGGAGLGDDDRDRVADEPHLVLGERRAHALAR